MPTLHERKIQEQEQEEKAKKQELESKNFLTFFNTILNKTKEKEICITREHLMCNFNAFGHLKSIELLNPDVTVDVLQEEAYQIVSEYHARWQLLGTKFLSICNEKIVTGMQFVLDWAKKTAQQDKLKADTFNKLADQIKASGTDINNTVQIETDLKFNGLKIDILKDNLTAADFVNGFAFAYFEWSKVIYDYSTKIFTILGDNHSTEQAFNNIILKQNSTTLKMEQYHLNIVNNI